MPHSCASGKKKGRRQRPTRLEETKTDLSFGFNPTPWGLGTSVSLGLKTPTESAITPPRAIRVNEAGQWDHHMKTNAPDAKPARGRGILRGVGTLLGSSRPPPHRLRRGACEFLVPD